MKKFNDFHKLLLEKRWDPWIIYINYDEEKDDDEVQIRHLTYEFCEIVFWAKEIKDRLPYMLYFLSGMAWDTLADKEASVLLRVLKILIMAYGVEKKLHPVDIEIIEKPVPTTRPPERR